jgi:hypothetical protein
MTVAQANGLAAKQAKATAGYAKPWLKPPMEQPIAKGLFLGSSRKDSVNGWGRKKPF